MVLTINPPRPAAPSLRFTARGQVRSPIRPKKRKVAHRVKGACPMSNPKPYRPDLVAVALLLAGGLLALTVVGADPGGADGQSAYPPRPAAGNVLGPPGAAVAEALHQSLGGAA